MDWQIRIAVLIIGIFVIGFIVYDFKRRKKSQADKQRLIDQMRQSAEHVDAAGFDFTGVGSARPVSDDSSAVDSNDSQESPKVEPIVSESQPSSSSDPQPRQTQSPISQVSDSQPTPQKTAPTEQLALQEQEPPPAPDMVLSLILQADEGGSFKGKDFMPLVLSQGLRHGEMGIFHRHTGGGGKPGVIMYSVANAIKPGIFDLTNIESFETPAFAFFMTMPGPTDPIAAFEGMVKTIKMFQSELGGQILDDSKSVYTEQRYQHQLDTLREYITKSSLQSS